MVLTARYLQLAMVIVATSQSTRTVLVNSFTVTMELYIEIYKADYAISSFSILMASTIVWTYCNDSLIQLDNSQIHYNFVNCRYFYDHLFA